MSKEYSHVSQVLCFKGDMFARAPRTRPHVTKLHFSSACVIADNWSFGKEKVRSVLFCFVFKIGLI